MHPDSQSVQDFMDVLLAIFAMPGTRGYRGSRVTMLEHMLQTAVLAERAQASDELVTAALLHDTGQFGTDFPVDHVSGRHAEMLDQRIDRHHEEVGAQFL